jgi:hypothetical protein
MLNINYTSVTGKGLLQLETLQQLSVLICNDRPNLINGRDLVELTKTVHTIRKLQLCNLDVSDAQILQINENSQSAITHLYIQNTKITVKALLELKKLKVVRSYFDSIDKIKLKAAGI